MANNAKKNEQNNAQEVIAKNEKVITGFNYERKEVNANLKTCKGWYVVHYDNATDDLRAAMIEPKELFAKDAPDYIHNLRNVYFTMAREADAKRKQPTGLVSQNTCYMFIWRHLVVTLSKRDITDDMSDSEKNRIRAAKRCRLQHKLAIQAEAEANRL